MKNCVLYICHFINDFSITQYNRIKNTLNTDLFDIYYCTSSNTSLNKLNKDELIIYDNNLVYNNGICNASIIAEKNIDKLSDYEYIYITEYDVYYPHNWNDLLIELNEDKSDLLCAYVKKYEYCGFSDWMWTSQYFEEHKNNKKPIDNNIKYYLKSCISFYRISYKGLKFITEYNNGDLKNYIYEMYVPTLLYNYGYSVKSLSSIKSEDDNEFYYKSYIKPKYYYGDIVFDDYIEMNNIAKNDKLLFTRYKSQKYKLEINRNFNSDVLISVVMPVYNDEKYLKDSINSVLNQNNAPSFEFIIVNDGSTDSSEDIIKSFNNDCIVYIKKDHSGIVDSLNLGIKNAIGRYILRMDSDDIMMPDRLKKQYDYMESNEDIDICGFGFEWGNNKVNKEYFKYENSNITLNQLVNNNCIGHPTVIMRKASIDMLPYLYESYFEKCEDYKLWCTAASYGLHIASSPEVVLWYRQHDGQETNNSQDIMWKNTDRIKKAYGSHDNNMNGKITIIIPFKNEGYEIEKTVCSIRSTTTNLPIILINDGSDDKYDYKKMSDFWNCTYIEHEISKGVAQSRDEGISLSNTEYFVLLDGHMRFYEDNWDIRLLKMLEENPKAILSAETHIISKSNKDGYDKYINEYANNTTNPNGAGAYINFDEEGWEFTGKWTHVRLPGYENTNLLPTSCLMGACYCSNKTWWNHIGGLQGLIMWGQDEPLISIKTWLAGGQILLIKDFVAGHIYRTKPPYDFPSNKIYSNSIMMNHLFSVNNDDWKKLDDELKKRIGEQCFNEAMNFYKEHEKDCIKFKEHFWKDIAIHDLDWFKDLNNKCYKH